MIDANKIMRRQYFVTDPTDIRIRSRLIRKPGFKSRITFVSNFGVGLRSLGALVVIVVVVT